jgi:diguanylate cyclase (GGDEF)-like protein/PAS domain S-box-containing protein
MCAINDDLIKNDIVNELDEIMNLKLTIESLRESEALYQNIFKAESDSLFLIDQESGNILKANDAACFSYGYSNEEIIKLKNVDMSAEPEETIAKTRNLEKIIPLRYHKKKDGTIFPVNITASQFIFNGKNLILAAIRDISESKALEEELEKLSYRDPLTNLYNRRFYQEELTRLDTSRNYPLSIAIGDINGLKLVNDSFGHLVGDELIRKTANAIRKMCRNDDIIARIGGDEFVIILPKTSFDETELLIRRIEEYALTQKVEFLPVSITFGYETKTKESESIESIVKKAEDKMYNYKLFEGISNKSNTIELIMNSLYLKNDSERLHATNVSDLCVKIATALKFERHSINQMKIAGLMHDIGRIAIDASIISKVEILTNEERKEIERHSETGYRILTTTTEFSEIAVYILEHHERWDGQGYPKGIRGNNISIQARIIAITDSYDAMTSDRVYCKALNIEEAIEEIKKCAGTQFDPNIAKVFVEEVLLGKW